MPSDSPSQLGKYQLVGIVGEGAMGVVHRAFDPVLNRTLAIKVMSSVIASDAQLRERFLREARAAGSLQHPNVITIYDFGELADHLFIAMEFVEGYDLAEIVSKRLPLSVEAKLDILIDTLHGLGYAHSHGVVHRDIKPANIRVTAEGRAKLMDFGIAHMQQSDLTKSGEMIGTPQYMAPEQVTGDPITAATDLFSVGCVAYELFSNIRPFDGDTLHAILFNIVSYDPPLLSEVAKDLPSDLDDIIALALMKDPKARFESANAMAKAFKLVRQSLSPTSDHASLVLRDAERAAVVPTTLRPRSLRTARRRKQLARNAGITVGALGLVALAWWAPWKAAPPPESMAPRLAVQSAPVEPAPSAPAPAPAPTSAPTQSSARDSEVATLRTTALDARRQAVSAGATAVDLSEGDLELQAADAMTARTRPADAISRLIAANQRWSAAERTARDRAQAAATRTAEPSPATLSAPAPVTPAVPATSVRETLTAPPALPPALPTATESRAAIERVVAAYEQAIESGELARIRRAYPGITSEQQLNWQAFYRAARNLRATFTITSFEPTEDRAAIAVDAVYEYDNRSTSRTERNSLKLLLTVVRDESGGWRLSAVR